MYFAKSVPAGHGDGYRSSDASVGVTPLRTDSSSTPVMAVSCGYPGRLGQLRLVRSTKETATLRWRLAVSSLRGGRAVGSRDAPAAVSTPAAQSPLRETMW